MSQNDPSQKSTSLLTYYFNNQQSFYYNELTSLFKGVVLSITMPNNDSSKSVITFTNKGTISYYTLNSLYISLNSNNKIGAMYELILQCNKNDYANNSTNQILFIIPIFNNVAETLEGSENSITKLNNLYISSILKNIAIGETYNYTYGSSNTDNSTIDINKLLIGINTGNLYTNIIDPDTNIMYNIIEFDKSNIFYNLITISVLENLKSIKHGGIQSVPINILNNNGPIATITQSDIYIDCSPTNKVGEVLDVYTSKNLDQLNLFQINDLKIWAFRFITIFVILIIIFVTIKMFHISDKKGTLNITTTPSSAIAASAISQGIK